MVTGELIAGVLAEELAALRARGAEAETLEAAAGLFEEMVGAEACAEFLTLGAYPRLS